MLCDHVKQIRCIFLLKMFLVTLSWNINWMKSNILHHISFLLVKFYYFWKQDTRKEQSHILHTYVLLIHTANVYDKVTELILRKVSEVLVSKINCLCNCIMALLMLFDLRHAKITVLLRLHYVYFCIILVVSKLLGCEFVQAGHPEGRREIYTRRHLF